MQFNNLIVNLLANAAALLHRGHAGRLLILFVEVFHMVILQVQKFTRSCWMIGFSMPPVQLIITAVNRIGLCVELNNGMHNCTLKQKYMWNDINWLLIAAMLCTMHDVGFDFQHMFFLCDFKQIKKCYCCKLRGKIIAKCFWTYQEAKIWFLIWIVQMQLWNIMLLNMRFITYWCIIL